LENGLQIGKDWRDGKSGVNTIALSPDRKTVVCGSDDRAVRLWDIDTRKVIAKWTGHRHEVWSVCWSRDGQRVVSGSKDGTIRVWNVESGETILGPIDTGLGDEIYAAIYSPDESMIATGSTSDPAGPNRFIKIWDAKTHKLVTSLKGGSCLAWTEDGKTLISGSPIGSITKWNTTTWNQFAVLTKHTDYVRAIAISPNGRILASASHDGTARLWNLENGQPISSPLQHARLDTVHPFGPQCISFSADGELLATGCEYNAYTWDIPAILKEAGFDHLLSDSDVSIYDSLLLLRPTDNNSTLSLQASQVPIS
jgi:WD40 repeat protein